MMEISRNILGIRIPYGQVVWMGRRRVSLSALLFCNFVEGLWTANEGFFRSNRIFGGCRGRCRVGCIYESWSHSGIFAAASRLVFSVKMGNDCCVGVKKRDLEQSLKEWAYINRLKRSSEIYMSKKGRSMNG